MTEKKKEKKGERERKGYGRIVTTQNQLHPYNLDRHFFGLYFRNLGDGIDTTSLGNFFLCFTILQAAKKVYPESHLL